MWVKIVVGILSIILAVIPMGLDILNKNSKPSKKTITIIISIIVGSLIILTIYSIYNDNNENVKSKEILSSVEKKIFDLKTSDSLHFASIINTLPKGYMIKDYKIVPIKINFDESKHFDITSNNQKGGQTAGEIINNN